MLKKIPVVMLPTKKASKLCLKITDSFQGLDYHPYDNRKLNTWYKPQHLYFLSDEEIKEGDWYLILTTNTISKAASKNKEMREVVMKGLCKKIIATTDESLKDICDKCSGTHTERCYSCNATGEQLLPQPPQIFIEQFIKKYNAGTPITHVMIKYEIHPNSFVPLWIPKINPKDNTITIKPVKNSLNRKEIINFIMTMTSTPSSISKETAELMLDKWIEQTYKVRQ